MYFSCFETKTQCKVQSFYIATYYKQVSIFSFHFPRFSLQQVYTIRKLFKNLKPFGWLLRSHWEKKQSRKCKNEYCVPNGERCNIKISEFFSFPTFSWQPNRATEVILAENQVDSLRN